MEFCLCPECGAPAEVVTLDDADPARPSSEIVGVRCVRRHWFLGLREALVA